MADPAKTVLGRMLTDEITPVVMVLRTPLVEEACQKNGLSFVDMLSPFAIFDNIDVPVRTASDQSYRLQQFKLRLCYASDIQKPPFEAARERLNKVITEAAERDTSYLSSELTDTKQEVSTSKAYSLPSWFEVVNKELIRASSFSDHEAFDHPVACLLVVSSKDDDPINKFVDLFNTNQLPSILNDGAMDPQILKHFLLLHDNQDGPPENASKVLSDMKSMFGSSDCQLLCINSSQDGSSGGRDWPWASYQRMKVSFSDNLGCLLSLDDINEMKVFMHALSTKHVIPHMEQKIRVLNLQVSATRKGFRNQIKNLWWRKGKDDSSDTPTGPTYTYTSIESQIRVLGDYAFMLQDYELALSNYRLISTDYKLDKAWQRYAGVQELMGLTYFMLDQSRKEAEYCMETAFTTYLKLGTQCQQNAVRCGLWWVELLKAWEQHKDAASVYFRISGEDPLQSAIMLEQASYCYLYSVPSMPRKYGFHLVLSGDSYDRCKQTRHAIRAYKTALSVFESTTWSLIKDHIRFQLGKWFASLGMLDIAINHMLEILACTHQSKTAQELFLHDFLQLVQKTGKTFEVCRLQLPIVRLPSLRVVFEDQRTYASPAAVGVRESVWQSLEENVVPPLANAKVNWLELHTKLVPKDYKESNICVAGEAVKVDIGFKNPLQIPISISNVSLVCKHLVLDDEIGEDASSTATGAHDNEDLRQFIASNESCQSNSFVTLSEVDFSLNGGETLLVQLTATPREEGILKIVGVRWKLSGSVVGFQNFEFSDIKKRNAKGRRKSKRSPGCELKFLVIKPLPRLEGSIRHFPKRSYHGELYRLVLELRNQSDSVVKNVKLKISHPRFLLVANPDAMNSEFPACLTDESSREDATASKGQEVNSLFQFPEDVVIHGKPFTSPLWLHAAIPGPLSLQIIVYYEVGDASSIIRYRTLRMSYNLEVLPSLEVSFKISRCPSRSQEVFVCMDAINKTSSETFQVCQLSAVGSQWGIMMLQPFDIPWHQIAPGQALSLFFRLKNSTKRVVGSENKISSDDNDWGSHVRLGVEVNNKAVYNVLKSPLADFHHHERLQQEQPEQEGPSESVEFILISQPETNEQQLSAQSRLFSHHACHCSLASTGPLYWLVDGPKTIYHDFTSAFCEINLKMSIYNSLNTCLSVNINTHDNSNLDQTGDSAAVSSENEIGWHCVSLDKEKKVLSDGSGTPSSVKHALSESAPSFIWTGISSTKVELGPSSAVELPMQICVFTPGIYDISSYQLQWNLVQSEWRNYKGEETSGVCSGRPFFITVVQCT